MTIIVNINHMKKCAFCKYWYDPANSAIAPKVPVINIWEIRDINQKCMCLKKNIPMSANAFCNTGYEKKI